MPASEVHEYEFRKKLSRCTDFYSQSIDDVVHTLPEYTHRALWRPKCKYKSTDENGQMHLQMKLILQSNEII